MKPEDEKTATPDPEIVDIDEVISIARHPGVPITVTDLAAMKEQGKQIIAFRLEILSTLRAGSIRATNSEDWLLFRADVNGVEVITGYLQDKGCARIVPVWGINIAPTSEFILEIDGEDFSYSIEGYGTSAVTGSRTEKHTGIRYSTEDFCKDIPLKMKKKAYVKLAARANLDGHIVRELTGLEGVPVSELTEAWKGTGKTIERCARGRGFGSGNSRFGGGVTSGIDDADIPNCAVCAAMKPPVIKKLVLRKGSNGREDFFGCANYAKHPEGKSGTIPLSTLQKQVEDRKAATAKTEAPREPGDEG